MLLEYYKQRLKRSIKNQRTGEILLGILSFTECIISPISPLFLMLPLCFKYPNLKYRYLYVATVFSTLGAICGYIAGAIFIEYLQPYIYSAEVIEGLEKAQKMFLAYGGLTLLISSITVIPFKLFAITSGILKYPLYKYILYTLISRLLHFYMAIIGIDLLKIIGQKLVHYKRKLTKA
jgi:membrane protein YqaA with SNARE-associated domain